MSRVRKGAFTSLALRDFRWFLLGRGANVFAFSMEMVARGWLAYPVLGHTPMALGWVTASFGLSMLSLSLLAGTLVDRTNRKNLFIFGAQSISALLALTTALLLLARELALWHLVLFGLIQGGAVTFNITGRQALVPELVGRERVVNAVSLDATVLNIGRIVGPALAGVLMTFLGAHGVYFITAGLYALSAFTMLLLHYQGQAPSRRQPSVRKEMGEGLRFVTKSPILSGLLLLAFVSTTLGMPFQALMPAFVADVLGREESALGFLLGASGVGAIAGTLALASLGDFKGKGQALFGALFLWGVALGAFAASRSFYLALPLLLGLGMGSSLFLALIQGLLQLHTPAPVRGRVMSLFSMSFALMPLGTLPLSVVAAQVSTPWAFAIGALGIILFASWMYFFRPFLRRLE